MGISFFTFQALGYLLDVYHKRIIAEKDFLTYALFVSFFPSIVAGPINKASLVIPQLKAMRPHFNYSKAVDGLKMLLWGMFMKVVVADRVALYVDTVFPSYINYTGLTCFVASILYTIQIYADFAGYSLMAIGVGKTLGFELTENFRRPYFAVSVTDFWRRWHISLGAWFRNYVYIPLGGNRCSTLMQVRNLLAVWILTGIWHGSTLNFLVWGLYHGAFVMLERFVLKDVLEKIPKVIRILVTDFIVYIGWVLFFSPSMGRAIGWYGSMFGADGMGMWNSTTTFMLVEKLPLMIIAVLFLGPWIRNLHDNLAYKEGGVFRALSILVFAALFLVCTAGIVGSTYTSFLYVQF